MVVNTEGSRETYTANGVTTTFSFPHYIKLKSEIVVYVNSTLKTLNTDYTIAGTEPLTSGGNIVFTTAPASGAIVKIRRITGLTQSIDLSNSGAFDQEDVEDVLDDVVLKTQESYDAALDAYDDAAEELETTLADYVTNAETAATSAASSASSASTSASTATAAATTTTTAANSASASALAASNSAGEAGAIAAGSLNTYTLLPSGTWNPTISGDSRQITGTTTINLPAPAANFYIKFHVVGDQAVTVNRNGSETIYVKNETVTDDVSLSQYGFYTITCLGGSDWTLTRSTTTDVYVSAPAGAAGEGVPAGGTAGQVLSKIDGTDYNTQWSAAGSGDLLAANNLSDLANAATARTNLGVDAAGTDNSTDVTLAGVPNYITIAGQVITRALINLASHVTGLLPIANGGTNASTVSGARTNLGLAIGSDVQAHSAVLDATTASFTTADETKLDGIEAGADVTDTANVTAAGALMDSEVDANIKTLVLPASTTISAFGASLIDDASASAARTTLGALANLVEDTTPQLGGELDCGANSVGFTAQTATGDGTTTIDWGSGNKFNFTFGAFNETFTFTAPAKPGNFILKMTQDGVGSRTATWPASVKWPGGTAPTLSTAANAVDIVSFYYDSTNYYGQAGLSFS